jgi:hypothetical protein
MSKVAETADCTIGAIYPDDVWVDPDAKAVVDEFREFLPQGVDLIAAATFVPARAGTLDLGVALAENGDIEEAARRLMRYQPAGFAYYCTTISFAHGLGRRCRIESVLPDASKQDVRRRETVSGVSGVSMRECTLLIDLLLVTAVVPAAAQDNTPLMQIPHLVKFGRLRAEEAQ